MRIDPAHGTVELPSVTLGPTTSRAAFETSPVFAFVKPLVENPPWKSWSFEAGPLDSDRIIVSVHFEGSILQMIDLVVTDEPSGVGWDDWTIEKEAATKNRHDALCREWLGEPTEVLPATNETISGALYYLFPWGTVLSGYDSKGGSSMIVVRYGNA